MCCIISMHIIVLRPVRWETLAVRDNFNRYLLSAVRNHYFLSHVLIIILFRKEETACFVR